ncbi:MAG: thiol peroxidase [Phycisphaera sp.]|nr:thiol peroxidase [Phycisphaera sp.]
MTERTGVITFKGNPMTLVGPEVKVGSPMPDFTATGNDMKPRKLSEFKGKTVVVSVVPSLDTPVCDMQTRKFNEEAGKLGDGAVVLTLSVDLPMAQKRWCGAAGATHVTTLSDYKDHSAGVALGVRIKELGLLTRAVFVVDKAGVVKSAEYVSEVTKEPDYAKALAAVKAAS